MVRRNAVCTLSPQSRISEGDALSFQKRQHGARYLIPAEAHEAKTQVAKKSQPRGRRFAEAVDLTTEELSDVFAWLALGENRI